MEPISTNVMIMNDVYETLSIQVSIQYQSGVNSILYLHLKLSDT